MAAILLDRALFVNTRKTPVLQTNLAAKQCELNFNRLLPEVKAQLAHGIHRLHSMLIYLSDSVVSVEYNVFGSNIYVFQSQS